MAAEQAAVRRKAEARQEAIEAGRVATSEMERLVSELERQRAALQTEIDVARDELSQIDAITKARQAQLAEDVAKHRRMVARYAHSTRRELSELDQRLAELSDSVIDLSDTDSGTVVIETAYGTI